MSGPKVDMDGVGRVDRSSLFTFTVPKSMWGLVGGVPVSGKPRSLKPAKGFRGWF